MGGSQGYGGRGLAAAGVSQKGEPWTFFSQRAGEAMRRQEEAQAGGGGKGTVRQQVWRSHTNQERQERQALELASCHHGFGVSRGPAVSEEKGREQQPGAMRPG